MAVESLNNIFDISALQSNLKVSNSQSRNKNNINDKWFDDECKNTRKTLRNQIRQIRYTGTQTTTLSISIIMKPYNNTETQQEEKGTNMLGTR